MAQEFPEVLVETQILIGKTLSSASFSGSRRSIRALLILARHGGHRIEGTDMGSQADNLCRLSPTNILLIGTTDVRPDDIPWIEEDGETGLEWAPDAEVRILRVPPFALGIARKAVEEYVLDNYGPGANGTYREEAIVRAASNGSSSNGTSADSDGATLSEAESDTNGVDAGASVPPLGAGGLPMVTGERLDEAITKLLPTHMQLIMGIGTAEELALAEVKADEAMKRTLVNGLDADPQSDVPMISATCPYSGHPLMRERTADDPVEWTQEAFERLKLVPLIARPTCPQHGGAIRP